ncbi:hypothetical protein XA68_12223 [Ophiocordyceps unilateralis]|uniref:C2H2-type domain-containing protein n=1 Tax=Ophiocordyceps unilateralis TaxID=268505 RepID=A0A2A9PF61_OPHUN|nr:hypothetical protein XA68_12223 [Ophiocordyceps unilateralis]
MMASAAPSPPADGQPFYPVSVASPTTGVGHDARVASPDDPMLVSQNEWRLGDDADLPVAKKKRSRKGLGKRFECTAEGCGKSYSRAEHLYRHQLNHNSRQIFYCEYPDCPRTFVRGDLLKRHMDRHAHKGPHLGRRDALSASQQMPPGMSLSEEAAAEGQHADAATGSRHQLNLGYQSPQDQSRCSPFTATSNTPPGATCVGSPPTNAGEGYRPDASHGISRSSPSPFQPSLDPYEAFGPREAGYQTHLSSHLSASFVSQHGAETMRLPQSRFPGLPIRRCASQTFMDPASTQYPDSLCEPPMVTLSPMVMQGTGQMFGHHQGLGKPPCVGMPEDFMAYLFTSLPSSGSSSAVLATSTVASKEVMAHGHRWPRTGDDDGYGDAQSHQYAGQSLRGGLSVGGFSAEPQQVMAVDKLLEQDGAEATLSEGKSRELFELIKDRFHEHSMSPTERRRDGIVGTGRAEGDDVLSRRMMQIYLSSYWHHFSDQVPILHKPTFSPEQTPNLLLLAMMTLGAACLDRISSRPSTAAASANVSDFLARHLRWEIFTDQSFRPPAKLWVFQALILLELYEKMYSTREMHERAHVHHGSLITLMRRGRSLVGKSGPDSPPEGQIGAKDGQDGWWRDWVAAEAMRRVAYAALVVDATHVVMFGHSGVMAAHELNLTLPCDEALWRARTSAEFGRIESTMASQGIKTTSFFEGLKRTLSHAQVPTTPFGRTVLMSGLLSVTYHMNQLDLEVDILGGNTLEAARDSWRTTMTAAYDFWKADFDRASNREGESSMMHASRSVLHHLAHMATHADIVDCQIFAGAKRLLGRVIGPHEHNASRRRICDSWARTARARDATFHALKFLASVLLRGPYEARSDVLMNRPWVLYFAVLIVWCYGFALEGPCPTTAAATMGPAEARRAMRGYLLRCGGGVASPSELQGLRGVNENTALLVVLRESFEKSRWDLLREAAQLLRNCLVLNAGGAIAV